HVSGRIVSDTSRAVSLSLSRSTSRNQPRGWEWGFEFRTSATLVLASLTFVEGEKEKDFRSPQHKINCPAAVLDVTSANVPRGDDSQPDAVTFILRRDQAADADQILGGLTLHIGYEIARL